MIGKRLRIVLAALLVSATWAAGHAAPRSATSGEADGGGKEGKVSPLDDVGYSRAREIRQKLCLRNGDLAAMGLSRKGDEHALGTLVSWYRRKADDLRTAREDIRLASRDLRAAMKKVRMGPRNELLLASIPILRSVLALATKAQRELVEEAGTTVAERLHPPMEVPEQP